MANHHVLTKRLDTEALLPDFISAGLISLDEQELIKHEVTGAQKTDRFLTILHRRGTVDPSVFTRLFSLLSDKAVSAGQLLDDVLRQIEKDSSDEAVRARFVYSPGLLDARDNVSLREFEDKIISALTVSEVLPQLISFGIVDPSENDVIR